MTLALLKSTFVYHRPFNSDREKFALMNCDKVNCFCRINCDANSCKSSLSYPIDFISGIVNPALNNLYALTLKKSDLAPRVVLMLSDILRYVLYESNQGEVSILKEIKHIKDYIEIERLRLGNMVRVEIEISDQISDQNIEPMLLLTLVENAFKHSESVLAQNRYIKIVFENLNNGFRFLIENSYNPSKKSIEMGCIGLQNIKKRLTLTYPGKHELVSSINDDVYQVDLIIYFN